MGITRAVDMLEEYSRPLSGGGAGANPDETRHEPPPEERREQEERCHDDEGQLRCVPGNDAQSHATQQGDEPDDERSARTVPMVGEQTHHAPATEAGHREGPSRLCNAHGSETLRVTCPANDCKNEDHNEVEDCGEYADHGGKTIDPQRRH